MSKRYVKVYCSKSEMKRSKMKDVKLLYEQIAQQYRDKILNNDYKADEKLPTGREIAEEFGVSLITSKRALEELKKEGLIYRTRGSGTFVSNLPHEGNQLGLEVNKSKKSKTIAIVIPNDSALSDFMYSVRGACAAINERGYNTSVYSAHKTAEEEKEVLSKLYEEQVLGVVLYPLSNSKIVDLLIKFSLDCFHVVAIDKYFEGVPMSYVVSDNFDGMYKSVKYLYKLGHRNIALVSDASIEGASSVKDRYFGYCKALKDVGLPIVLDNLIIDYNKEATTVYEDMITNFIEKEVTAIIAIDDIVASFLLRAAIDLGVKVPEELSIMGFDDGDLAKTVQVPLTTVAQDFFEMGHIAASMIIERDNGFKDFIRQVKLPTRIIERESTSYKKE